MFYESELAHEGVRSGKLDRLLRPFRERAHSHRFGIDATQVSCPWPMMVSARSVAR